MSIAYIIHPNTPNIRQWVPKKANLAYIFEPKNILGKIMAEKGVKTLSLTPEGHITYSNLSSDTSMIKDAKKANYLLWRKFMVLYHFKTTSFSRRKRKYQNHDYMLQPIKRFVLHNQDYRKAYETIEILDREIRECVFELLYRECSEIQRWEQGIQYLLNISQVLFYGYMDHLGCNRHQASIFQSHYYYLVINLALQYELDNRDFEENGSPSKRILMILSRLFNESIVHRPKGPLLEKYNQIRKIFELIDAGVFTTKDFTTI